MAESPQHHTRIDRPQSSVDRKSKVSVSRFSSTHGLLVAALIALAVFYAWPLASRLSASIPSYPQFTDVTEYVWSVGWVVGAVTSGKSLFHTDAVFVPFGNDLRLNTFGLLQGLGAASITPMLGI